MRDFEGKRLDVVVGADTRTNVLSGLEAKISWSWIEDSLSVGSGVVGVEDSARVLGCEAKMGMGVEGGETLGWRSLLVSNFVCFEDG